MQFNLALVLLVSSSSAASSKCKVDKHSSCPSASTLSCLLNQTYHEEAPSTPEIETDFYSELSFTNDDFSLTRTQYCPPQRTCPRIGIRALPVTGNYRVKDIHCVQGKDGSSALFSMNFDANKPKKESIKYKATATIAGDKITYMTLSEQGNDGRSHIMIPV